MHPVPTLLPCSPATRLLSNPNGVSRIEMGVCSNQSEMSRIGIGVCSNQSEMSRIEIGVLCRTANYEAVCLFLRRSKCIANQAQH